MIKVLSAAALATLMLGCASGPDQVASAGGYEEKEEITGSNLPRRKQAQNVAVMDREAAEQQLRSMPSQMSRPPSTGR